VLGRFEEQLLGSGSRAPGGKDAARGWPWALRKLWSAGGAGRDGGAHAGQAQEHGGRTTGADIAALPLDMHN